MSDRFKVITSSYLLLVRAGKILLLRRYQTGYEDGKYSVPAGHVEDNETMTDCMSREAKEEIGVDIAPRDLQLVHVMHRKKEDIRVDFFFTTTKQGLEPFNREPEKCDDLSWYPLDNLPENTIPYIRAAIIAYQKKEIYSNFGWD